MQIDIAQHVEKLLFEHETVLVPTFGGFTATRSPASLDAVGGTIAPSSKTLAFNSNLTVDDGILVHDIAFTRGISEDDARRLVMDFVEKTKEALDQREIVTLPGIGRLYKNYAQKVQFLPDTTNFNTDSFGLPKIQFASVPRGGTEGTAAASNGGSSSAPPAPATETAEQKAVEAAEAVKTPIAVEPTTVEHVPTAIEKPAEVPDVAEMPVTAAVTREVKKPMFSPMAIALGGILIAAVALAGYFLANRSPSKTATTEVTTPPPPIPGDVLGTAAPSQAATAAVEKDDDATGDIPDAVEEEYASKKQEAEQQFSQPESKSGTSAAKAAPGAGQRRCVLIVGTFQDRSNVDKLIDKLKTAGLDTYHRRERGHQVGIEFYYSNLKEVQAKMKQLEDLTGESNIWIKKK